MNYVYFYFYFVYNIFKRAVYDLIKKYLDNKKTIKFFNVITSTNTVLKELAEKGEKENTILITEHQTAGRGRFKKSFFSPKGCGIYLSYLIKPDINLADSIFITIAAAVSMVRAIDKVFNIKTKIKWVNDIYFDDKKLCGILTEGKILNENSLEYAIVGVGINFKTPPEGYPDDFAYKTTNLEEILKASVNEEKKWRLAAEFINIFDKVFSDKSYSYVEEYKKASCIIGRNIDILSGEHKGKAFVLDIDEKARLVVKKGTDTILLDSGDVSISFFE